MTPPGPAPVYWITGLSGSGKTTVARLLCERLRASERPAVFLDGDELRSILADDLGYDSASRLACAMRYARLVREFSSQGVRIVIATISMFHEVRRFNRTGIARYCEVWLRVPIAELERRDPKGIYGRARRGELENVPGLDLPVEEPEAPDLAIDNHGPTTAPAAVERIWREWVEPRDPRP